MFDYIDKELKEIDSYLNNLEKNDIPVPEILKDRIIDKGKQLKRTGPIYAKLGVSVAVLLLLFFSAIFLIPGFAAYASDIPGLGVIVEWVKGDKGIEYAREHGYGNIPGVTVSKNDYRFIIDDIFFDEDRLSFKIAADGPYVEKLLQESSATHIAVKYVDFTDYVGGTQNLGLQEHKNKLIYLEAEKAFKYGEVERFLETDPKSIKLELGFVVPNDIDDVVTAYDEIDIPFSKDNILRSKAYEVVENITLNGNDLIDWVSLSTEKLSISPTRIQLIVSAQLPEGFELSGFENPRLVDDKGKVYQAEGLVEYSFGTNRRALYFVPSVFYKMPKKLTFLYDGIRFNKVEGRTFKLRLDEVYPKTITYMGESIVIRNASYTNDSLNLVIDFPDSNILRINGVDSVGSKGRAFYYATSTSPNECFIRIDEREEYDVNLESPGYLLYEPGEMELKIQ